MYLEKLRLDKYRNYELLETGFSARVNIFCGNNAQGKTNLIEAIYYLATAKAYRPARDMQLIKWENDFFRISGEIVNKSGTTRIDIIVKADGTTYKEIRINGVRVSKMAEVLGNLTAVLFAPEDLNLIKGPPGERRKLLDNDISQSNPGYFVKLQQFNRILSQRNHLLKRIQQTGRADREELKIWNMQLLSSSIEIIKKRTDFLEKLAPLARLMHRKLTNGQENLEIRYLLNRTQEIKREDKLQKILETQIDKFVPEEIRRGVTLWGPHRDDLLFLLNGNDLKNYGSQGQHRTAALAVKLAEIEYIRAETGEFPVLLLDDVLSELDKYRREQLIGAVFDKNIQCFITATDRPAIVLNGRTGIKEFEIEQGRLFEK